MSNTPSYAAIIDAGSTSSRLFVYQWQSDVALGEPLSISKVFPSTSAEKKASEAQGGIQHKLNEMDVYLQPALQAGRTFLQARNVTNVPLYLIATGGMRESLSEKEQGAVLRAAHRTMQRMRGTFNVGTWTNNARVIPGRVEGLYGWVALNYGRGVEEQISGLLELGGASMQIAYKVPEAQLSREKICLLSGEHRVYSQTWDGFGADSAMRRMLSGIMADAGGAQGTGVLYNPCLPRGAVGATVDGSNRTTIGNGDFATCLQWSKTILKDGLKTRDAIPSYLDIASFSKHFYGVSNYWYNYQFFAKWGAYEVGRAYDRKLFTEAVTKYCSSAWGDIQWVAGDPDRDTIYTKNRCFYTAWMLTLLHDEQHGFGLEMTQYDTWRGLFRFPTTTDLASRSSWTIGAAALIARHGELSFCPTSGAPPKRPLLVQNGPSHPAAVDSALRVYPPPTAISQPSESCRMAHSSTDMYNPYDPSASAFTAVLYGIVVFLVAVIGYQRRQMARARASQAVIYTEEKNGRVFLAGAEGSIA